MSDVTEKSYGIVPLRKNGGNIELLVVQEFAGHWGFPKGHAEKRDASDEDTALRELSEETGITECVIIKNVVFESTYHIPSATGRKIKEVTYYVGVVDENDTMSPRESEVRDARWVKLEHVCAMLTYDSSRQVCKEVHSLVINQRII